MSLCDQEISHLRAENIPAKSGLFQRTTALYIYNYTPHIVRLPFYSEHQQSFAAALSQAGQLFMLMEYNLMLK